MTTEIKTWELIDGNLKPLSASLVEQNRKETEHLEKWIKTQPEIIGNDIVIIGEQEYTKSGKLDFLGIDKTGNTVIIELKRDMLPREVLAQALDYASDISNWEVEKISEICTKYTGEDLADFLSKKFEDINIGELSINQSQRILLVGFSIEESLNRMIEYLSNKYDLGINAVILNYVKTSNNNELLSRTMIIPEEVSQEKSNRQKFQIPMSDEPGDYSEEELRKKLKDYFTNANYSSNRIKNVLLPALLKKNVLTRKGFKQEFINTGEAPNESQAGYFIALISNQLGHAWKDYLRQIIKYEYPNYEWEKDNFSIRKGYNDFVKKLLDELNKNKDKENK
mgnify:CR=1 FL=1